MKNQTPIVRLFFAKMKPDFFQLSEHERGQFMARDRGNLDALGMKAISMIDCRDSDAEWDYIGIESWPSRKAVEAPGMSNTRFIWALSSPSRNMANPSQHDRPMVRTPGAARRVA